VCVCSRIGQGLAAGKGYVTASGRSIMNTANWYLNRKQARAQPPSVLEHGASSTGEPVTDDIWSEPVEPPTGPPSLAASPVDMSGGEPDSGRAWVADGYGPAYTYPTPVPLKRGELMGRFEVSDVHAYPYAVLVVLLKCALLVVGSTFYCVGMCAPCVCVVCVYLTVAVCVCVCVYTCVCVCVYSLLSWALQ